MPPEEQIEQLIWYFSEHYPAPVFTLPPREVAGSSQEKERADAAERWVSHLVDRTTHAAILQLGTAVDNRMPQVAWTSQVDVDERDGMVVLSPPQPSHRVIVSVHGGDGWIGNGAAYDYFWLPLVAALAQQSGCRVVDARYPLYPDGSNEAAVEAVGETLRYAASLPGVNSVTVFADGSGAELVEPWVERCEAAVLRNPRLRRASSGSVEPDLSTWPPSLVQEFSHSSTSADLRVAAREVRAGCPQHEMKHYYSTDYLATPEQARLLLNDAAEFLRPAEV